MKCGGIRLVLSCLLVFFLSVGCQPTPVIPETEIPEPTVVTQSAFEEAIAAHGLTGGFALYDLNANTVQISDIDWAETRYTPASTFKILNSMIALETGVAPNVDHRIVWDGTPYDFLEEWNQDHTMRTAIQHSVVWYYQALAREIGPERMAEWVDAADYGNENIGGAIDSFWLDGDLKISPLEQIDFLTRLVRDELPFSPEAMAGGREITIVDQTEMYTMHAKTGWAIRDGSNTGWYVGWLDHDDNTYVFALAVFSETLGEDFGAARIAITREILAAESLLPE